MMKEQYLKRIEEALQTAIENARYAQLSTDELIMMLKTLMED